MEAEIVDIPKLGNFDIVLCLLTGDSSTFPRTTLLQYELTTSVQHSKGYITHNSGSVTRRRLGLVLERFRLPDEIVSSKVSR